MLCVLSVSMDVPYSRCRAIKMTNGMTLDEFFEGAGASRELFEALRAAMDEVGDAEVRVTKSQIAFRRRKGLRMGMDAGQVPARQGCPAGIDAGAHPERPVAALEAGGRAGAGAFHPPPGNLLHRSNR